MAMSLLERYDEMQRRPFGTNTALSDGSQYGAGGTAGSQFRRQEQAYGRALRLLDRQARRGDVGAAIDAIKVRESAMGQGYAPGGIRRKDEADQGLVTRVETTQMEAKADAAKAALERQSVLDKAAGMEGDADGNGIPDSIQRPTAGETPTNESFAEAEARKRKERMGTTVNPNATAGAGRGRAITSRWDNSRWKS